MKNMVGSATNQGNISLDGEKARISEAAYGVIMDLLSNLYTNASEAVLREYSVNGWDEHQKHGVERPIEVTLPSLLQPTLVIRDFGPGLPLEGTFHLDANGDKVWDQYGAMQVFGEYGESSKRDTDTEVGGFGIGSKAAYALGHQFMVTGYHNGQTFTCLFTLDQDGRGTKSVLHEGPTTQPNGVEISLGVDDVDAMNESAARFFSFWDRGDVLVDGEVPTPIFESLEKVSDEIYLNANGRGEAYAVMGPVAYPVDRSILRKVQAYLEKQGLEDIARMPLALVDSSTDLYLRVPIGGVIPAPNREALRDKERTVHTLASVFLALHQESQVKIQNEVDAAPSFAAAARAFEEGNAGLGVFKVSRSSVLWQGQKISRKVKVGMDGYVLRDKSWRSSTKVVGVYSDEDLEFDVLFNHSLVVTGVSEGNEGSVRRFVKRYLEENEDNVTRVFVTPATAVSYGWFQVGVEGGARTVTLEGWREILRGMRKTSPRTINEPSYSTGYTSASRDLEDRDLLSEIIEWGKDLVLFTDNNRYLNAYERKVLEDYTPVVLLATQSQDALHKRVEADGTVKIVDWQSLRPQAVALAQAVLNGVTDAERDAMSAQNWLAQRRGEEQFTRTMEALRHFGEVTSTPLLATEEAYALAQEFASGISTSRVKEIEMAVRFTGSDFVVPEYEDTLPILGDLLPLLSTSAVRDKYQTVTNSWATRNGVSRIRPRYYGGDVEAARETHRLACKYMHHVLAYVNTI